MNAVSVDGPTIGAIVGVTFGCVWGLGGATGLPRPWRSWVMGFSIAISLVLIVALLLPHAPRQSGSFRGRTYGIAVGLEGVAIFAAVLLLRRFGLPQFLLPVIGFIVGLHFVGLWRATNLPLFLWVAVAMCVVCGVATFLPNATKHGIDAKTVVAGLGCAVVLWFAGCITILWTL